MSTALNRALSPAGKRRTVHSRAAQNLVTSDVYPSYGFILLETGEFLLLETGDKIFKE